MTKAKKLSIIIVSVVLAIALITTAIVLIIVNNNNKKREQTETTIMTCSVNPKVQFILNGNDKVMKVVALNSDGQDIALNGEFVGLKAEQAAELFISLSTETGLIDIDTTGTKVEIIFSGLKNDYNNLKNKVVESVNGYFDKNGIIAGAVAKIDEDLKNAIYEIKETANTTDKSDEELMAHYLKLVNLIKSENYTIDAQYLDIFFNAYDSAEAICNEATEYYNSQIELLTEQLEGVTDTSILNDLQDEINRHKELIISADGDLQRAVSLQITARKLTEEQITKLTNEFQTKLTNYQADIADHLTSFNNNKTEIQQKIAEYRNSLVEEN